MNKLFKRWRWIILITITIRLSLFVISIYINPHTDIIQDWVRWDGPHYIDIAKNWYQTQADPLNFIVFYPLYPLLIKLLAFVVSDYYLSSLIISWLFSFTASILLFELTLLDFSKRTSLLSVWFLNIFPTSFFLQASYTESLFLTVSLASIYLFRKKAFIESGAFGAFATFTRINGLLLLPFFLTEQFLENLKSKKIFLIILTCSISLMGFLIYLLINYYLFNDFLYFTTPLSEHWYKRLELPQIGIKNLISFTQSQTGEYYYLFWGETVAIIFASIMTIITFFKLRFSYAIYMLSNLILFTSTSFIMSTPRYLLILFPVYILLGMIKNKFLLIIISVTFILLLLYLTNLYTIGHWAY